MDRVTILYNTSAVWPNAIMALVHAEGHPQGERERNGTGRGGKTLALAILTLGTGGAGGAVLENQTGIISRTTAEAQSLLAGERQNAERDARNVAAEQARVARLAAQIEVPIEQRAELLVYASRYDVPSRELQRQYRLLLASDQGKSVAELSRLYPDVQGVDFTDARISRAIARARACMSYRDAAQNGGTLLSPPPGCE